MRKLVGQPPRPLVGQPPRPLVLDLPVVEVHCRGKGILGVHDRRDAGGKERDTPGGSGGRLVLRLHVGCARRSPAIREE